MYTDQFLNRFILPADLGAALRTNRALCFPETLDELTELCYGPAHADSFDVSYDIEGMGRVKEAEVHRCKNGVAVNFTEDYMRRRDGGCLCPPRRARRGCARGRRAGRAGLVDRRD